MIRKTSVVLLAAALAACVGPAAKPEASTPAATPAADANPLAALSPEDRNAFFVNNARSGDLAALRRELDAGIDINVHDNLGQTALLAAVSHGAIDGVRLLLARHADPNATDSAGWTALHYATYFGVGTDLIDLLLQGGAAINARNDRGITALYFATAGAHAEQVRFLLAKGADREVASNAGYTPLRLAQTKGFDEIVALLDPAAKAGPSGPQAAKP